MHAQLLKVKKAKTTPPAEGAPARTEEEAAAEVEMFGTEL